MVQHPRRVRPPLVQVSAIALTLIAHGAATAAPYIEEVMSSSPPHAQAGATIGIFGHGFTPPVQVYFSDGSSPSVAATPVAVDAARGIAIVRVPSGAVTGNMKVTAGGQDSNLFYFRRDAGTFARGASAVTGQVLDDSLAPVPGAVVILLSTPACDGDSIFWDHAVTGADGRYTVHGQTDTYGLFVFPPAASGLAVMMAEATPPATADVTLYHAVQVQGRMVLASAPATGVADARVEFEGDGFDTTLTDASGNWVVTLPPGPYEMRVRPAPSPVLAGLDEFPLTVGMSSPQVVPAIALSGGVRIHGTIRRQADSTPLPGIEISAWPYSGPGSDADALSRGDGSYTLVVQANATYGVSTWIEDTEPYVPGQVSPLAVGATDVQVDFSLQEGALVRGRVTAQGSSAPLADIMVMAFDSPWGNPQQVASDNTCDDGTYTLHVPPRAGGYLVVAGGPTGGGGGGGVPYVPAAYDAVEGTALFPCEGTPVILATVGATALDIDLALAPGAGWLEGAVRTQASGCTQPITHPINVQVDDGAQHECSLGLSDWTMPTGTYRILGLPNVNLMPVLRACIFPYGPGSGQCYDMKTFPEYTSVPVPVGGGQFGVDFCYGQSTTPTQPVAGLQASKVSGQLVLSWSPSSDPAVAWYRVRGSHSPRPAAPPGSFPDDPSFHAVWDSIGAATTVGMPLEVTYGYFLVVGVGATGAEGPSGHYPLVP